MTLREGPNTSLAASHDKEPIVLTDYDYTEHLERARLVVRECLGKAVECLERSHFKIVTGGCGGPVSRYALNFRGEFLRVLVNGLSRGP